MPCYDPETDEFPKRAAKKINTLTQLLCKVCADLEAMNLIKEGSELADWWGSHKKADQLVALRDAKQREFMDAIHSNGGKNNTESERLFRQRVSRDDQINRLIGV